MVARNILPPLALLPLLLTAACVDDVGTGKVVAEVAETPVAVAPVQGESLAVDTSRSRIHALGAKVTATHDIEFDAWTATLKRAGDEIVAIDATVSMDSLRADAEKLTGHLKSPDFFDVSTWPEARFQSSAVVRQAGPDGSTHKVTGALTMRGATKTISFPAKLELNGTDLVARAEFVIDRRDFGIVYPGRPDDLIQPNVVLTIDFVAPRGQS